MNILYYPEINIPRTEWAIRAFLYYDEVAAIVPYKYNMEPDSYEPFMREILVNELVTPIDPMMNLRHQEQIQELFQQYVTSHRRSLEQRKGFFHRTRNLKGFKLHEGKFSHSLYRFLEELGLAKYDKNGWYDVEPHTANDLMYYLASVLANTMDYRLSTDQMSYSFSTTYIHTPEYEIRHQNNRRNCILKELIPVPIDYDLRKIRHFKETHRELLRTFRNHVEEIALDATILPESELFSIKLDQLRQEKEEISARMNESHLGNIILGKICGVFSPMSGVSALLNAIYNACHVERPDYNCQGMKYIVLAERNLIRK